LADELLARGYAEHRIDVMHLRRSPVGRQKPVEGLTILPARAAFRHARQIADEEAREWGVPQIADAKMMHLDDPHTDALVALRAGQAVAIVLLLTVGEVGLIHNLFVHPEHRRRGIGTTMMDRGLEICARSQFRHVLLGVAASNEPARRLHDRCGFVKFAEVTHYVAPT
jgi:ribosomal protein S18 acetylase RimI-like enzyme